ncbi:hypothetical protein E2C01_040988 [Portunus trituberculatus]|uniref:Uncharacterized protein n=1 Tax=Portunus trituberculatus TaxID=210409 RepID=A0A5B7FPG5_PORTR|nr:hypothetical protein [Portunus trituberculatus]
MRQPSSSCRPSLLDLIHGNPITSSAECNNRTENNVCIKEYDHTLALRSFLQHLTRQQYP